MGSDIGLFGLLIDNAVQVCGTILLVIGLGVGGWLFFKHRP
jgi:hypothetical protein